MPLEVSKKRRVLSGMRPTGKLHLGNLVGALNNWVKLQSQYDCFHFIADWHALTSDFADPSKIKEYRFEMMIDWLAAGLDPKKSVMFVQSAVPQHAELHLILSMITPLGWLERVPSYKEQRENLTDRDLGNYGFLGYPVLQAADILMYKGNFVPVGEDQVPHVELTREICRRFNSYYGFRIRRSEEHTSELQSPCNLVCRLLLEKKKKQLDASLLRSETAISYSRVLRLGILSML